MEVQRNPSNSNLNIIKDEKIGYNQSIIINSKELNEVFHYSREFDTNIDYKLLTVQLNIPYTATMENYSMARILLYLDEDMIYDGTICSHAGLVLRPLNLFGHKSHFRAGHHKIKLMACTSSGELHIPHLNLKGLEFLIKPSLSGSYLILGYN